MVPDRDRITSECVVAPPARYLTPAISSPSVIPVAAKNTSSEDTRVVGGEHAVQVVPGVQGTAALVGVPRRELALDDPAQALERAGGDDRLGRAADAEQQVDAGAVAGQP